MECNNCSSNTETSGKTRAFPQTTSEPLSGPTGAVRPCGDHPARRTATAAHSNHQQAQTNWAGCTATISHAAPSLKVEGPSRCPGRHLQPGVAISAASLPHGQAPHGVPRRGRRAPPPPTHRARARCGGHASRQRRHRGQQPAHWGPCPRHHRQHRHPPTLRPSHRQQGHQEPGAQQPRQSPHRQQARTRLLHPGGGSHGRRR